MEVNIYDANLNRLASSSFTSLVWTETYAGKGSFQLVFEKNAHTIPLAELGKLIGIPDSDTLMFVQSVEDKDGQLWLYGCESKYLLFDRIATYTHRCSNIESSLRTVFSNSRPYSIMGLGENHLLTATASAEASWNDLFTLSQNWCGLAEYGFTLKHDKNQKKLLYEIYQGRQLPTLRYSSAYGNLNAINYKLSESGFKNYAYVCGQGEGTNRVVVEVGDSSLPSFERRELYVDADDINQDDYTASAYAQALRARGLEKLNEANKSIEVNADIKINDYRNRVKLGDVVTCLLPEWGLTLLLRISEVALTYEENKKTITATFGKPVIKR